MSIESDARFWDKLSGKYAKHAISDPASYERTLDCTRKYLTPQSRVLELGCGTGSTALRLAGDVTSYLATDVSPAMISIARSKQAAQQIPGLTFENGTAETVGETGFDAVLGFNYLHLVRDLPGTLRRIHALLKDDGVFISKTPCVGDMNVFIRLAIPVMQAIGKAPHVCVLRGAELGDTIAQAGFRIIKSESHATKGNEPRPYIVARKI